MGTVLFFIAISYLILQEHRQQELRNFIEQNKDKDEYE